MGLVKRRSPAARVQGKDGQACLLMPWDTVFSEESGGGEGPVEKKARGERKKKSSEGVWWPHVTLVAKYFGVAGS